MNDVGESAGLNEALHGAVVEASIEAHKKNVLALDFEATGNFVATVSADGSARLWSVEGLKLVRSFKGDGAFFTSLSFSHDGDRIAIGASDGRLAVWSVGNGDCLWSVRAHDEPIRCIKFVPSLGAIATGSKDGTVKFWPIDSGSILRSWVAHPRKGVLGIHLSPDGQILATCSRDRTVKLWNTVSGDLLSVLVGHQGPVNSIAFDPQGGRLASASADRTVKFWSVKTGALLASLEAHTHTIDAIAYSPDGFLLASKGRDGVIVLWNTAIYKIATVLTAEACATWWIQALAFHPNLPLLASIAAVSKGSEMNQAKILRLWRLDLPLLTLGNDFPGRSPLSYQTTAKIVLVGDSSVGKTSLGWRLAHNEFKEHSSTHGQQFWVLSSLSKRRADGTECEAVLWDLAGQADYRLIHALFLDDADLALVLFDPSDSREPLRGVEFWVNQLRAAGASPRVMLVAARADRGGLTLAPAEVNKYCAAKGIDTWLTTSAKDGSGMEELVRIMDSLVRWDEKPTVITTRVFRSIKEHVLKLKEEPKDKKIVLTLQGLRRAIYRAEVGRFITEHELETAVGHLENYGYVKWLRSSKGDARVLLAPELLNNLASSCVLEARRHQMELGALEETRLLNNGYLFRELDGLGKSDQDVLLDSSILLFLKHNVAFRETDPLTNRAFLVFPELINLKKPPQQEDLVTVDGPAYSVTGATENVYASMVVLMGYTQTFTRRNQWQNHARYEVGNGWVCGFRQEGGRDGELEFVLYYGLDVDGPVRTLFQSLFETFLMRRNLTVLRFDPIRCDKIGCGATLDRTVVRARVKEGKNFTFCNECGHRLMIPKVFEEIQSTQHLANEVAVQREQADRRTRFEQAIFRVRSYISEAGRGSPRCFISYAWGDTLHEKWIEKTLASDLQKAGIDVILDRWENAKIGSSVARFVSKIAEADKIVVVGTPAYRLKYENKDTTTGYVVAAEVDMLANRLLGTEPQKESVLPILFGGEKETSLPPLLHGRVYGDFRQVDAYFLSAFDLVLSLYGISPGDNAVRDLREALDIDENRDSASVD